LKFFNLILLILNFLFIFLNFLERKNLYYCGRKQIENCNQHGIYLECMKLTIPTHITFFNEIDNIFTGLSSSFITTKGYLF
jgi:EamA domain-containing membrane protein RarD